ncbi:MAG: TatD family hydrolase [Candidatus Babeliales bacterium]
MANFRSLNSNISPQELRGKQNHPQYIQVIARFIAQLRGTLYEHVAQVTTDNANGLLHLLGI